MFILNVLQVESGKPLAEFNVQISVAKLFPLLNEPSGDNFPPLAGSLLNKDQRKLIKSLYTNRYKRHAVPVVWLNALVEEQYFEYSKEIFNTVLTKHNIPSRVK